MRTEHESKADLLSRIRDGKDMTLRQQLRLTALLSVPAVIAQISTVAMQYIDAAMVGSLGAGASASIGLMSTTLWLFWGLCSAATTGFSVQVAHLLGAKRGNEAKSVLRQSFAATQLFSVALLVVGFAISERLPFWLGGSADITENATAYFRIFVLALPAMQLNFLAGSMLRSSGNMLVPGALNVLMCLLDVAFNWLLIFPSREISVMGLRLFVPGANMGVAGAALGTVLAEAVVAAAMLWFLCFRSADLKLAGTRGRFRPRKKCLKQALRISLPMGGEHAVLCGAHIMTTVIVAPLGTVAIAANAFAIIAESLCYMPGYGIADAATTLIGQSLGAARKNLAKRFAHITVFSGMAIMGVMGAMMFLSAPAVMAWMTPDADVRELGAAILRIEAFAEPMFAASIIAYGVFVGAGDTLIPCAMNLFSIWAVRLSSAALLAPHFGLRGVWIAMCLELCFRGFIFLFRLLRNKWTERPSVALSQAGTEEATGT